MENSEKLYKFIYPNSNDLLLKLSGTDLRKLFDLVNNSYLELRSKLNIDKSITFGMEIESEYVKRKEIEELIPKEKTNNKWTVGTDITLDHGLEVKSPILTDEVTTWEDVNKICLIIDKYSKIGRNAGGHIHIGSQILSNGIKSWINFIRLWGVYENITFRFLMGEFLTMRPNIERYAKPLSEEFLHEYNNLKCSEKNLYFLLHDFSCRNDRDCAINLTNLVCYDAKTLKERNTIEFRCPNGTLNPTIWQNNVNLFVKMLNYSKNSKYDSDTIYRRYKVIKRKKLEIEDYNKLYLEQALEFCDLIFDNNLDKIYFLKQYLKLFEVYNGMDNYLNTKRKIFTR